MGSCSSASFSATALSSLTCSCCNPFWCLLHAMVLKIGHAHVPYMCCTACAVAARQLGLALQQVLNFYLRVSCTNTHVAWAPPHHSMLLTSLCLCKCCARNSPCTSGTTWRHCLLVIYTLYCMTSFLTHVNTSSIVHCAQATSLHTKGTDGDKMTL